MNESDETEIVFVIGFEYLTGIPHYMMNIRTEKESDEHLITEIHDRAFNNLDEGKIVERLRNNNNLIISFVAEIEQKIVGHIAYSPVFHENQIIGLGLGPVGILPGFQKQGIGTALIQAGNERAFLEGFSIIFVLGDMNYYAKFGFEPAKPYNFFSLFDPEGNHFMMAQRKSEPSPEKIPVHYCEEFHE